MSNSALKSIVIEHLRGSTQPFILPFDKGKNLTIIYGDNASGKSTICDGIEFIGSGRVGSLDNRGLGKTNPYWCSIGKKPSDVSVSIETEDAVCSATIGTAGVIATPPQERPRVQIIRRAQIQDSIEAPPASRYSVIKPFIDISGVEAGEAALRELVRNVTGEQEIAIARVNENRSAIVQFWEEAGNPPPDPYSWAEIESKQDTSSIKAEADSLNNLKKTFDQLTPYPERYKNAQDALDEARNSLSATEHDLDENVKIVSAEASDILSVLVTMKDYLSAHPDPAVCPVCESAEKASGLSERIDDRLKSFETLQEIQTEKKSAEDQVMRLKQRIEDIKQEALELATNFEKMTKQESLPGGTTLPQRAIPKELSEWEAWFQECGELPEIWSKAENVRGERNQYLNTLKKAITTYHENYLTLEELAVLLPKLKDTLAIVEEERRQFTDNKLKEISDEVGRLYELVHPGEGLDKISIALDPAKRASLEMGASFLGLDGVPPQAYFSDSHLDTLGLCIFLALAALEKPDETILVLDDVLGSIDEPHVDRLIEMIYQEAMKFRHCIITTHYRPWKQKLRWGWLKTGQCQFVELTKWTAQDGMILIHAIPDIERLRILIGETPPDPQLVCSKAGVILEAILDFLTQHYECRVPRRAERNFTLGDLLLAISKKLRQALLVDVLIGTDATGIASYKTVPLAPMLEELTRIAQVRNVFGAHFNEISFDLLESDAIGFGQTVVDLFETLVDEVKGWPRNGKSGSYWATGGETRRLHPYVRPE